MNSDKTSIAQNYTQMHYTEEGCLPGDMRFLFFVRYSWYSCPKAVSVMFRESAVAPLSIIVCAGMKS